MKGESPSLPRTVRLPAHMAGILVVLGVAIFLAQALLYAHTKISSLDEGAYLYKGYLFATGQYRPFEPYGPWTNKAPLSFLIPGVAQALLGAGLRTGRYLSIAFGVLTVILTWLVARRLGGKWLAAASVWAFALNPVLIKIFSEGVSQSEVTFTLALVLALSLGENRPLWQLVLAGFLAGTMIMIRQNMVIVLPLLVLYIWWQNGWRAALYAALAGVAVPLLFHILFWPYIVQLWTPWMPASISRLFAPYIPALAGSPAWNPDVDLATRLLSFFQGIRFHFVAMAGFIFALLLWPARKMFSSSELRAAVFLALLFASLLLMHAWAAIGNNYCVYCFASYLAFFSLSSILLVTLVLRVAVRQLDPARQALLVLAVIIISLGIGYSAVEDIGNNLLELNIPLLGGGRISPGLITLGKLLSNKFALERTAAERILSTAVGALLAAAFLGIAWLVYIRLRKSGYSYGYVLAVSVLLLGLLFSPVMEASGARRDCPDMDVIRANEQVGHYLAETIPAGKMTYWNGGLSVAPLLHAAAVHIYLPQINDGYARRIGGDAGQLLEYGFWNDELDARWMQQADFIIVEGWRYTAMKDALPASTFDELPRSPVPTSCVDRSRLRVFQRK